MDGKVNNNSHCPGTMERSETIVRIIVAVALKIGSQDVRYSWGDDIGSVHADVCVNFSGNNCDFRWRTTGRQNRTRHALQAFRRLDKKRRQLEGELINLAKEHKRSLIMRVQDSVCSETIWDPMLSSNVTLKESFEFQGVLRSNWYRFAAVPILSSPKQQTKYLVRRVFPQRQR